MSGHLIVDGYNLARSGGIPLESDPVSEAGRRELCALLAGHAAAKGLRLTVVFDGRGSGRGERSREPFKGGTALYSSASESADDVIREMARSAAAGTIVVTSDRGLAGTLPSRRVAVVPCDEFAARLEDRWLLEHKGAAEEPEAGRRPGKKGEGHRPKKSARRRDSTLRKL